MTDGLKAVVVLALLALCGGVGFITGEKANQRATAKSSCCCGPSCTCCGCCAGGKACKPAKGAKRVGDLP
jgi:hypothetical protein